MNYLAEIKAFYEMLELNPLSSPVIALWHALMHIANKTGWQEEFTVAISVLMLKSGLNETAVKRARNRLEQDGYIEWKSRKGNQSAIYKINSLVEQKSSKFEPQIAPQSELQNEPQIAPQSEPINKHKQKQIKEVSNDTKKKFEPPAVEEVQAYCHERGNSIDAQRFVDFYTANGWVQGKGKPIKDWKAVVRTWERNEKSNKQQKPGFNNFQQHDYDFEAIERALTGRS